jgi:putative FmdB family regulatory protein
MPVYEYECLACLTKHEIMQKITDKPLTACPACGGKLKKIISNTSFVLKGTGWYATDYAPGKPSGGHSKTENREGTKPENKQEGKTEAKKSPAEAAASK